MEQGRGHAGGIIRNNMIYHAAGNGSFADVGIAASAAPDVQIYNNTIFMENSYPNAIEYRFAETANALIVNNLSNKAIVARDGASGTAASNTTNAVSSWFVNPAAGDLHLAAGATSMVDAGQAVAGLSDDFDSQSRPAGSGIDRGADEMGGISSPTGNPSPSLGASPTQPTPTSMYATPTNYCLGACPTPSISVATGFPTEVLSVTPAQDPVIEPTSAPQGGSSDFIHIILEFIAVIIAFLLKALQMGG